MDLGIEKKNIYLCNNVEMEVIEKCYVKEVYYKEGRIRRFLGKFSKVLYFYVRRREIVFWLFLEFLGFELNVDLNFLSCFYEFIFVIFLYLVGVLVFM